MRYATSAWAALALVLLLAVGWLQLDQSRGACTAAVRTASVVQGCAQGATPPAAHPHGHGVGATTTAVIGQHVGAAPVAGSMTAILTVYRRGERTLLLQLAALDASSERPSQLLLYQTSNASSRAVDNMLATRSDVGVVLATGFKPGVFGRFTLALQAEGENTCVFDDDVVPLPRWLETVARAIREHGEHTVVGCSGRSAVFSEQADGSFGVAGFHAVEGRATDEEDVAEDRFVDFPIHCYCARTAFFRAYWGTPHYRAWGNGEDIAMGAIAQLAAGGRVVVPRQSRAELSLGDNNTNLGADDGAVSHSAGHGLLRVEQVAHWVSRGWRPAAWPSEGRLAVGGGLTTAVFPLAPSAPAAPALTSTPAPTRPL